MVKDYVSLRKRGVNYVGLCPFHDEKTGSFTVSAAKGIYKCFGCGKGGNVVNFIMEIEQLNYVEALRFLAKKYHIEFEEREQTPEERALSNMRESMMVATAYAQRVFSEQLMQTPDGQNIGLSYFRERGFRDDIIAKFQLGYCFDQRDAFTKTAQHDGYKSDVLVQTGLCIQRDDGSLYDRFYGRVMFPIHSVSGRVIAFGGRTLKSDKRIAKYQNSPESDIYHKSNVLYGIFFAKRAITHENKCFLVEGYTDVLSLFQAGIENVVASSGTSLTVDQIKLIKRFTPNVTILYDGDSAGIKASQRGTDMVLEAGLNLKIVLLPPGDDPDSFAKAHSTNQLMEYIAKNETDFIHFKTKLLLDEAHNDPIKRAGLIQDIVRTIGVIPDRITRSVYIKECSGLLEVPEQVLYAEIVKVQRKLQKAVPQGQTVKPTKPQPVEQQLPTYVTGYLCEDQERELLYFMLRDGNTPLFVDTDNDLEQSELLTVALYIIKEIRDDGLEFKHQVYKKFFDAYCEQLQSTPEIDSRVFLNHPDPDISQLAVDLLSDKEQLSHKFWKSSYKPEDAPDFLQSAVTKAISAYKGKIVQMEINKCYDEFKKLDPATHEEERKLLLTKINELTSIKNTLSRGMNRVVP